MKEVVGKSKGFAVATSTKEEGEMYIKVREFLVNEKGCNDAMTWYTSAKGANEGIPIELPFAGSSIKPDVYGIMGNEILHLAEGKLTLGGHNYDMVRGQALANQRFCHYSYIFFPLTAFGDELSVSLFLDDRDSIGLPDKELNVNRDFFELVEAECNRYSLGLILVPSGEGRCIEVVEPKLSPHSHENYFQFQSNTKVLVVFISEKSKGRFENVYPTLIRDFLCIMGSGETEKNEILQRFREQFRNYENKNGLKIVDPMKRKKLKSEDGVKSFYIELLNTTMFLGLVSSRVVKNLKKYFFTEDGETLYKMITNDDKQNLFTTNIRNGVRYIISQKVYELYTKEIKSIIRILVEENRPIPEERIWCMDCMKIPKKNDKIESFLVDNKLACPTCKSTNLSPTLSLLRYKKGLPELPYAVYKFMGECGIFSRATYTPFQRQFPDRNIPKPPARGGLKYIWFGDYLKDAGTI